MKQCISRVLITSLCVMSCTAMAASPHSFDRNTTHTGSKGTTTSSVHQVATASGYVRDRTSVNPSGKVASRHTKVEKNSTTGVVTRSVDGTQFNGKTYSKQSTRTPTNTGFIKESSHSTASGKTRETLKVVEHGHGERTVDVTRVNARGQVSHRVTHSLRT